MAKKRKKIRFEPLIMYLLIYLRFTA
jgi:hypothetical protein